MADSNRQIPRTIENPFVKPQNREWSISLQSLSDRVSPPPLQRKKRRYSPCSDDYFQERHITDVRDAKPSPYNLAAVEAGKEKVDDHLEVFSARLGGVTRPQVPSVPRMTHDSWVDVYQRNQHDHGRHFVIHQHDHPIAGPHYDLRLQFSRTSSLSFAIMYGLPGNPNSRRLNRNATETRVHNLWVCSSSFSTFHLRSIPPSIVLPFREFSSLRFIT